MPVCRSLVAFVLLLVPATASAASPKERADKPARTARVQKTDHKNCMKSPVEVVSGSESATFSFTQCDGSVAPLAVEELSILARPASVAKPKEKLEALAKTHGNEIAPGIRRFDGRLLERLEVVADHFRKGDHSARVVLVSGVRPRSTGSYHQSGRAIDFRVDGVTDEALVAFCKTLPDTGCGYYPNSVFVHMDVRDSGAGHVAWIDASRPGETPHYVSAWPLPKGDDPRKGDALPKLPAPTDAAEAQLTGKAPPSHVYFF